MAECLVVATADRKIAECSVVATANGVGGVITESFSVVDAMEGMFFDSKPPCCVTWSM